MTGFLHFMNVNSGALTFLCTVVLTFVTIRYVMLTQRLVEEARLTREEQSKPRLLVAITPREDCLSFMDMVITNIGGGFAHDMHFQVVPDLSLGYKDDQNRDVMLSDVGFIAKGLAVFAPGQTLRFFLTSLFEDFERKMDQPITVIVSYKDNGSRSLTDKFVLDFAQFENMSQLGDPPMESIASSLKNMQKDIHNLATGWTPISVKINKREKYQRASNNLTVMPSVEDAVTKSSQVK